MGVTVDEVLECPVVLGPRHVEVLHFYMSGTKYLSFMEDYFHMLHSLLEMFNKKDVMDKVIVIDKLVRIDVTKKENLLPAKNADTGFATRKLTI